MKSLILRTTWYVQELLKHTRVFHVVLAFPFAVYALAEFWTSRLQKSTVNLPENSGVANRIVIMWFNTTVHVHWQLQSLTLLARIFAATVRGCLCISEV